MSHFSNFVVMYLYGLLLLLCSVAATLGPSCEPVTGEHAECACSLDDESGTIDINYYFHPHMLILTLHQTE